MQYLHSPLISALQAVMAAVQTIESSTTLAPSSAAAILSLRGILEVGEPQTSSQELEQLDKAILASLEDALSLLNEHRLEEGSALLKVLGAQLDQIGQLTLEAEKDPARSVDAIAERLEEQVSRLTGASSALDHERLHMEATLLAAKADIREELDRLFAHVAAARSLMQENMPVGRKLEFLAQEFNREANTLCSKSNAVSLTETGMALKVVIDQFREQILNIE